MADDRDTRGIRLAARTLSNLMTTPDEELDAFRERRLSDDSAIDDALLVKARDLLDAIERALRGGGGDHKRLQDAWAVLCGGQDANKLVREAAGAAGADDLAPPETVDATPLVSPPGDTAPPPMPDAPAAGGASAAADPAEPEDRSAAVHDGTPFSRTIGATEPPEAPSPPAPVVPFAPRAVRAAGDTDGSASPQPPMVAAAPGAPATMASPHPSPWAEGRRPAEVPDEVKKKFSFDVEALNKVPVSEAQPSTLPVDNKYAHEPALPYPEGPKDAPPPSATVDLGAPRSTHGKTAAMPRIEDLKPLPFKSAERDAGASQGSGPNGGPSPPAAGPSSVAQPPPPPAQRPPPASERHAPASERLGMTMPAQVDLPAHLQALTVEHYAALCAQCAVHPQWAQQIEARYHIRSPDERKALDRHWQAKLAVDKDLEEAFRSHYARLESWARGQQGR